MIESWWEWLADIISIMLIAGFLQRGNMHYAGVVLFSGLDG